MANIRLQQLPDGGAPSSGDQTYIVRSDSSYKATLGNSAGKDVGTTADTVAAGDDVRIVGAVPNSLQIGAGTGLTGGGVLTTNRTISLSSASIASLGKADTAVQPARNIGVGTGLIGGGNLSADRTISLSPASIASLGKADTAVQPSLSIGAGTGLTGGGDLSGNRTISLNSASIASLLLADSAVQPARTISVGTGLTGGGTLAADRSIALNAASISSLIMADNSVQKVLQTLTLSEQGIARANIGADVLGGFRNKIINGDFIIWQRGTSQTSSGYGSDDRWDNTNIGSTKTHTRELFTPGQTLVPGNPRYYSRTNVSSVNGAANYTVKTQRIEGVDTLAGKKGTLTFYAKADTAKNIAIELIQGFGSGGGASPELTGIGSQLVALTTNWKRYSLVVDIPSITGKTIGSNVNDFLAVNFWFEAGSNWNTRTANLGQRSGIFDLAHVSLVEGDATAEADPFAGRHIQQELALCQRYYEVLTGISVSGYADGALKSFACCVSFATTKRVIPTMAVVNWDDTGNVNNQRFGYFGVGAATFFVTSAAAGFGWMFGARATADAEL